jgi:hypothetical protein
MYTIQVPLSGWVQEPVYGAHGSSVNDLGCPRTTVKQPLGDGRRLSVALVKSNGNVEIEDATIEKWSDPGGWMEDSFVDARQIELVQS